MLLPTLAVASVLPVELPSTQQGGPFAFAEPDRATQLLTAAGFRDVQLSPLDYAARLTGGGGGLDVVLAVGPAASALAQADDAGQAAARAAVDEALAPYDDGNGAVLPGGAWLLTATA